MPETTRDSKSAPEKKKSDSAIDSRYGVTKTGLVGHKRETMLANELHLLTQLGKVRSRGHHLPPNTFTYGSSYEKIDGGVPEALSHWTNSSKANDDDSRYKVIRDFITLNKAAAKSGCVTTKENDQYRALHDIKKKVRIGGTGFDGAEGVSKKPITFPDDMVFGQPARPSTPIHEVLNHHYATDWVNKMQAQEASRVSAEKEATNAISSAYHTKASWLRQAKIPVDEKPYWKMPKFRTIEGNVDSFRTEFQRKKAYSELNLDHVPRQGVNNFKQGVYNVKTTSLPV